MFTANAVRSQQRRPGHIAPPIEEVDNRTSVFRAEALPPVISSVRLADQQQHGRTVRLLRAGDSFFLIARCEPTRSIKRVEVLGSRSARARFQRVKKPKGKQFMASAVRSKQIGRGQDKDR